MPKKKTRKKRGMGMQDMVGSAVAFVIIAVVLAVGAQILTGTDTIVNNSDSQAHTVITYGLGALTSLGSWLGLIALAVAAVIVLGIIIRHLGGMQNSY